MSDSNNSDEEEDDDYNALVVDDKEDVCQVIEAHLCQNGFKSHRIDKAFNARTALALLNSNQYFFIFLDVRLPDMDGTTLVDEIRKTSSKNKDAVLMMSSGENLDEIVKEFLNQNLLKEKIDIFLLKPFTQKDCDNYFDIDYMLRRIAKKKSKR